MGARCPHSPLRDTGWLTGWRLTFGGEDHDPWLIAAGCETKRVTAAAAVA